MGEVSGGGVGGGSGSGSSRSPDRGRRRRRARPRGRRGRFHRRRPLRSSASGASVRGWRRWAARRRRSWCPIARRRARRSPRGRPERGGDGARDDENEGATRRHTREVSCPRVVLEAHVVRHRRSAHREEEEGAPRRLWPPRCRDVGGGERRRHRCDLLAIRTHVVSSGRTCSGGRSGCERCVWGCVCGVGLPVRDASYRT